MKRHGSKTPFRYLSACKNGVTGAIFRRRNHTKKTENCQEKSFGRSRGSGVGGQRSTASDSSQGSGPVGIDEIMPGSAEKAASQGRRAAPAQAGCIGSVLRLESKLRIGIETPKKES